MSFVHKLFIGLKRKFQGGNLAYVSEAKYYGNEAESNFAKTFAKRLPNADVKTNVMIHIPAEHANAEIDCLILYNGYLFAVEIKHWKGSLSQYGTSIISQKNDIWTDEIHTKVLHSPFKQIKRAITLLKKETGMYSAWIEPIVYFEDADTVTIKNEENWFTDIHKLVNFIKTYHGRTHTKENLKCFQLSRKADCLYSTSSFQYGIINDRSMNFHINGKIYNRENIRSITIKHKFSYDILILTLKNNKHVKFRLENGSITVYCGKNYRKFYFSKLAYILLG